MYKNFAIGEILKSMVKSIGIGWTYTNDANFLSFHLPFLLLYFGNL